MGRRQPAHRPGALRPAPGAADGLPRRARPLRPGLLRRRPPGSPPQPPRLHRDRLGEHLRPQPVPPADGRRARPASPRTSRSSTSRRSRPIPATEGTRTGTAILAPPRADGDPHRRHRVRRRDQEVRVHGHELPAARRGRAADALGGERRRGGRYGRLLRPLGDRQDDALGRSRAEPHRRRRARLGRDGVFNFEGGCYAKTIRLSPMYEPDIFRRRAASGRSSRTSTSTRRRASSTSTPSGFTENTRGAYPLDFIGNADPTGMAGQPPNVVLLTADAFGVLPPITPPDRRPGRVPLHQRLHRQARRHRGRRQGAAGDVLGLLRGAVHAAPPGRVRARCWPSGSSAYGVPGLAREHRLDRRPVRHRRADEHRPHPRDGPGRARAARSTTSRRVTDPIFGVEVPIELPGRPGEVLQPRATWPDREAYDRQAATLARMFARELRRLRGRASSAAIAAAGPRRATDSAPTAPNVGSPAASRRGRRRASRRQRDRADRRSRPTLDAERWQVRKQQATRTRGDDARTTAMRSSR